MNIDEIMNEFSEKSDELDTDKKTVVIVSRNNQDLHIVQVGKILNLIRIAAHLMIEHKMKYIKNGHNKDDWDELWDKVVAEQALNIALNQKIGGKKE